MVPSGITVRLQPGDFVNLEAQTTYHLLTAKLLSHPALPSLPQTSLHWSLPPSLQRPLFPPSTAPSSQTVLGHFPLRLCFQRPLYPTNVVLAPNPPCHSLPFSLWVLGTSETPSAIHFHPKQNPDSRPHLPFPASGPNGPLTALTAPGSPKLWH